MNAIKQYCNMLKYVTHCVGMFGEAHDKPSSPDWNNVAHAWDIQYLYYYVLVFK
jgi:hypothetical protein